MSTSELKEDESGADSVPTMELVDSYIGVLADGGNGGARRDSDEFTSEQTDKGPGVREFTISESESDSVVAVLTMSGSAADGWRIESVLECAS